ncbi:hypothetical protein IKE83_02620 [Candidatus Saccharibacteria bacterium]|nr:hypothetical protein [Candidatus Saccharibacteria bacterium]
MSMELVGFIFFALTCVSMALSGRTLREAAEAGRSSSYKLFFAIIVLITSTLLSFETGSIMLDNFHSYGPMFYALEVVAWLICFEIGLRASQT